MEDRGWTIQDKTIQDLGFGMVNLGWRIEDELLSMEE